MLRTYKVEKVSAYNNEDGSLCITGKYEVNANNKNEAILQLNPRAKIMYEGIGLLESKDILVVMKEI